MAGNVPVEIGTRNALISLETAGRTDIPVHPGCARPMTRTLSTAQHVHGEDGMGDIGLPDPATTCHHTHAVETLLSSPHRHPGELTLVTLAPSPTSPPPCCATPTCSPATGTCTAW